MSKGTAKKTIALLLLAAMVFSLDIMPTFAEGADVTGLLTINEVTVTQGEDTIPEGGTIAYDKSLAIKLTFDVPVIGDGGAEGTYVNYNDTATIRLVKGLKVVSGSPTNWELKFGDIKVGTLTLESGADGVTNAKIVFDGDEEVFTGKDKDGETVNWSDVTCEFRADFEYDGAGAGTEDKTEVIEILGKSYNVSIPALPIELTGKKTGAREGQFIDWKVEVEPRQGDTPAGMGGYLFSDDLANVGEYVDDSFKIGTTDDEAMATSVAPDYTNKKLTYTFPEDTVGNRYLFFRTEIPEDMLYSNKDERVTNTAKVYDGTVPKFSGSDDVDFKFEWINKVGATANLDYENNVGEIIWTITANQGGATLENAVITDVLNEHLKWEEATLKTWNGSAWVASAVIFTERPTDDKYPLGTINTPVQLTIRTSVITSDSFNIGHTAQTIKNNASISWTGKTGIGSGDVNVGIGLNPISKAVGASGYNASTHTIPWQVSVKKSDINVDLYVLDLLVYGSSNFSWDTVAAYEVREGTVEELSDLNLEDIKDRAPQARYNQKYAAATFATSDGLDRVVYTLKNSAGVAVADLLVVTGADGNGIDVSEADQNFGFETIVTNPDVYANNGTTTIHNTAVLYSADVRLNQADASVQYTSRMLAKDMLRREHAANPDANKNQAGAGASEAYNYQDHTVVFRLHVNANNLQDFTNDLTTVDGQSIGSVTLTDTLPEGWEFVAIEAGTKFMLYQGTPGTDGKVNAVSRISNPGFVTANFATAGQAVFTFTSLTEPYVILVKARPTAAKIQEYFSGNATYEPENTATLRAVNWNPGQTVTRKLTVKSQIIDKQLVAGKGEGVITWTVEYKPNSLAHPGAVIRDSLDVGLDLRIGADGKLILADGNITAQEMTLNTDGRYSVGQDVTLVQGEGGNISYDTSTRVLQFSIPDSEKAYRLTYKTDVTANAGANLKNEVELLAGGNTLGKGEGGYAVASADVSATMQRSGWVEITKRDGTTAAPLSGVGFTLFAADGVTVIRTGTTATDGKLTLRGLPIGDYVLEETAQLAGYNPLMKTYGVSVKVEDDKLVTSVEGQTGANSNKLSIRNYKAATVGDLVISKTIAGGAADPQKEFSFTVTILGVTGAYEYVGGGGKASGIITFDAEGSTTLTLKGGESIRIKYLPKDVAYAVVEDDYSGDRYSTTKVGDSGVIVADEVVTAAFVNTKHSLPVPPQTGGLMITKEVTGEGADKTKQFAFAVTLGHAGETYAYTGVGVPSGTLKSGDTILLGHGQSITISGVPAGTSYAVEETDYTAEGYIANAEYSSGTITADSIAVARFTNTKTEEQPVEPVDPDEPGGPEDPDEPGDPGDPDEPIDGDNTPGGPGKPGDKEPGGELPKAGGFLDTSVLMFGGVLLILIGMGYALMKRKARNNVV